MLELTREVEAARRRWRWRGDVRPPFAHVEGHGEESVWDYPRPPSVVPDMRLVQVYAEGALIGESGATVRVLETASPPTFYLPPGAVDWDALSVTATRTHCEWKGIATIYDVHVRGAEIGSAAWSYHEVYPEYRELEGWVAFYPGRVDCFVDRDIVYPQPGHYYGGWVTREIIGPFKGEPGSEDW